MIGLIGSSIDQRTRLNCVGLEISMPPRRELTHFWVRYLLLFCLFALRFFVVKQIHWSTHRLIKRKKVHCCRDWDSNGSWEGSNAFLVYPSLCFGFRFKVCVLLKSMHWLTHRLIKRKKTKFCWARNPSDSSEGATAFSLLWCCFWCGFCCSKLCKTCTEGSRGLQKTSLGRFGELLGVKALIRLDKALIRLFLDSKRLL